ncbi:MULTISPECIES: exosortase family protein XrtF [Flavobacteriaceae]|uniref:Exosortase family protein XrtF n=2 Tax=Flavobacteriaceae TaxID=49546 RepID=A0A4Y8ATJ9_9FLAO|nr:MULTISPECIES: exosortase family protein XrtF [Flavobacteriaceae]TEW75168.1 exosortase family protein XrtF [Gramella jeungdoensis]
MQSNKTVIIFLIKFFGTYMLLFLIYSFYLSKNQKTAAVLACAPITKTVAEQSQFLLNSVGFNAEIEQHSSEMSIKLFINNTYVARVVEGCNAISIIILFIAFIVAFASGLKKTALYILFGSLVIYFINIVRIAVIALAIYKYPAYENVLHSIVFPGIIYGITFLLWFIWIQKFSKLKG